LNGCKAERRARRSYILIRQRVPSSIGIRRRIFKSVKLDRLTVGAILKQAGLSNQCPAERIGAGTQSCLRIAFVRFAVRTIAEMGGH
jgi:hypothetical protein